MISQTHQGGDVPVIVLASASPRRRELLESLGLSFLVRPVFSDESSQDGEAPEDLARRLAEQKALACPVPPDAQLVIGADTLVVLDDQVLGKPADAAEARKMLWRLRARVHQVITGVALMDITASCVIAQVATTPVRMRSYSRAEASAYVATGDPMDKAGAYAIQHPEFSPVENLGQCYANVMGLPLCHLVRALRHFGVEVPRHPLQACPYAVAQGGCVWSEGILNEPADRWGKCAPYDALR